MVGGQNRRFPRTSMFRAFLQFGRRLLTSVKNRKLEEEVLQFRPGCRLGREQGLRDACRGQAAGEVGVSARPAVLRWEGSSGGVSGSGTAGHLFSW